MKRLYAPPPLIRHLGISNRIYSSLDGNSAKVVFADPGRIKQTTHMAYLVFTSLKRVNPATDEGPEQIIRGQALLQKTLQSTVYSLKFYNSLSRIVSEV